MRFDAPLLALLLVLVPALIGLYVYAFRRRRQALAAFADPRLARRLLPGDSARRRRLKAGFLVAAVAGLAVALMEPQWGSGRQEVPQQGRDIVIALDVSLSMLAEDVAPNRLEHAKAAVAELVDTVAADGGHRMALVVFAGRASLHAPLTLDYAFFLHQLESAGPSSTARPGTRIGGAVYQALEGIAELDPEHTDIIVLSDGEDHDSLPLEAAATAATHGISVHTVGIGDAVHGGLIPMPGGDGGRSYLIHDDREVRTRMQPDLLRAMAQATGGAWIDANVGPIDLVALYREHIAPKPRRRVDAGGQERPVPRYQWFVLAALLLLAADMLVAERRPEPQPRMRT